jgi:hypothetical protein
MYYVLHNFDKEWVGLHFFSQTHVATRSGINFSITYFEDLISSINLMLQHLIVNVR